MKKPFLLLLSLCALCACGPKCVDCGTDAETPIIETDSLLADLVIPAPEAYRGLYGSMTDYRNRPDSLTVATADYDELWVQANPMTLGDELAGMFERQTPLGTLLQGGGVALAAVFCLLLGVWIIGIPFSLLMKRYYKPEKNDKGKNN